MARDREREAQYRHSRTSTIRPSAHNRRSLSLCALFAIASASLFPAFPITLGRISAYSIHTRFSLFLHAFVNCLCLFPPSPLKPSHPGIWPIDV